MLPKKENALLYFKHETQQHRNNTDRLIVSLCILQLETTNYLKLGKYF